MYKALALAAAMLLSGCDVTKVYNDPRTATKLEKATKEAKDCNDICKFADVSVSSVGVGGATKLRIHITCDGYLKEGK